MLNDRLFDLLRSLDSDELEIVWTRHLRKGLGDDDFSARTRDQRIEPISRELRHIAAHSIADLVRRRGDHDYAWDAILRQIADRLDVVIAPTADARALEDALLARLSDEASAGGKPTTMADASEASRRAVEALKQRSWRANYGLRRVFASIGTGRMIWGPNYRKLVPAVLFIVSAARTHEALKEHLQ